MILLERHGGYRTYHSLLAVRETERILRVTLESFLLTLLLAYFSALPLSRLVIAFAAIAVPIFVTWRNGKRTTACASCAEKAYGARRAVILGAGTLGRRVYSALVRSPKFGLDPVAFVDDDPQKQGLEIYESSYQHKRSAKVLAGPVCPELLRQLNASVLVIATGDADRDSMMSVLAQLSSAGVSTYFVPNDFSEPGYWIDYAELDGVMLAHLSKARTGFIYEPQSDFSTSQAPRWAWCYFPCLCCRRCTCENHLARTGSVPAESGWKRWPAVSDVQVPHDVPRCASLRLLPEARQ